MFPLVIKKMVFVEFKAIGFKAYSFKK